MFLVNYETKGGSKGSYLDFGSTWKEVMDLHLSWRKDTMVVSVVWWPQRLLER
jgi:hypothetical protein